MIPTLVASAAISLPLWLLAWAVRVLSASHGRSNIRRAGLAAAIMLGLAGLPPGALAAYLVGRLAIGQPGPEDRTFGEGVRYRRVVLGEPRRIVLHVLEVDLTRGAKIVVSPPAEGLKSEAMTATRAIGRLDAVAVANASYFHPFRESHPLDYGPHEGELVQTLGRSIGRGVAYGEAMGTGVTFWSDPSGRVGFGEPPGGADAAVTGPGWLVRGGANVVAGPGPPYPRTALGVDEGHRRLWLAVVDGKQPRYSEGMTLGELADTLVGLGASAAIQLDGGGSSTLAARDESGRAVLLSRPCHTKIPGRQRPVANFLGIIARRPGPAP